jgi:hypothetical protein
MGMFKQKFKGKKIEEVVETEGSMYKRERSTRGRSRGRYLILCRTWAVEGDTLWISTPSLTKDTKPKNKLVGKDEVKTDYNIKIDIKLNDLVKAGPAGPDAPKSRWRKKMYGSLFSPLLAPPSFFSFSSLPDLIVLQVNYKLRQLCKCDLINKQNCTTCD